MRNCNNVSTQLTGALVLETLTVLYAVKELVWFLMKSYLQ